MSNRYIIFVPGKNAKPPADIHHEQLWRCLWEGVRRVDPELSKTLVDKGIFRLVPWNPLFYKSYRDINQDLPWIDQLLERESPSIDDIAEVRSWKKRLAWLSYVTADKFPLLTRVFCPPEIRSTLAEIDQYFDDHDGIARAIRDSVKNVIVPLLEKNAKIMVVGHSLGSVIAYDTLWELTHHDKNPASISMFLTLGSPLGINTIQKHLKGANQIGAKRFPNNIEHWYNVAAHGELVALDRQFGNDFSDMLKLKLIQTIDDKIDGVFNHYRTSDGLNVHRCYGYFANPIVGGIIADWLRSE